MKILHVVASLQAASGGPAFSVTRLASEQSRLGHDVTISTLDYSHLGPVVNAPHVRVRFLPADPVTVITRGWNPSFRRLVIDEARSADVVHDHGLWMWPNAYAREGAVAARKPLVISPRGMLESWSLNRSKLRKAFAWRLFEEKNLLSAAMFHATSDEEKNSIEIFISHRLRRMTDDSFSGGDPAGKSSSSKQRGRVPIVVAPNGVDLPDLLQKPGRDVLETKFPELKDRRWVVFMSRLHPKKGIDVLLRAWRKQQKVAHKAYGIRHTAKKESLGPLVSSSLHPVLVLAGSDLIGYRSEVERMVRELGLADSVVITGEVSGEAKDCLLANADVFILPSHSENFGIVVAEAMAWGRPVIASTGTPWKEVADVGAGWWIKAEDGEVSHALKNALAKDKDELDKMGRAGHRLVESHYTWSATAIALCNAYAELRKK